MRPPQSRRRLRRLLAAGLATLVAAGCLALAPGASADEESSDQETGGETDGPAEPPFGEEVEPGTDLQNTTVLDAGTYTLNVPAEGEDHFFEVERSEPGEVIWYGVTSLREEAVADATLSVVGTADGDASAACNRNTSSASEVVTWTTSLYNSNRSGVCRDAESITLTVTNLAVFGEALPDTDFYQLTVWKEPAVEDSSMLPGANENSPWVAGDTADDEPEPLEPARTFSAAEAVEDGAYEVTVRQGQPAILAFPLTYGEHAQVRAEVAEPVDTFEDLESVWISPLGGQMRRVVAAGGPRPALQLDGEDGAAAWSTPIVTYLNRTRTGGVGGLDGSGGAPAAPAAFAGTYFLLLELPTNDEFSEFPEEVTLRLDAATVTDYEGSAPDWSTEPTALTALDGSGFVETAEEEQEAQEAQAEPAPWPLVAGLFGGAALLAAVGGVAVGRVLRSRS